MPVPFNTLKHCCLNSTYPTNTSGIHAIYPRQDILSKVTFQLIMAESTCRRGGNHFRYVFLQRVGIYLLLLILMITSDLDAVIGKLKGNICISTRFCGYKAIYKPGECISQTLTTKIDCDGAQSYI